MKNVAFYAGVFCLSISFFLGQLLRVPFTGEIAFIGLDFTLFVIVATWLAASLFFDRRKLIALYNHQLFRPFLIFISVCTISLLFNIKFLSSDQLFVAFLYLVRIALYYFTFFIIFSFSEKKKQVIERAMLITGAGIVSLGYVQLLVYPDLRNIIYLGWDDHYYRMVSVFLDPNFAGLFFVLYFLFILYKIFTQYKAKTKSYISIMSLIAVATFVAIFLTYSRTALLSMAVGVAIYLLFLKKIKYLLSICIVGVILVIFFTNTTYESLNPFRTSSVYARILAAENSLIIIKNDPIIGVGFNAYRYALERYGLSNESKYPQHGEAGTDNSILFVTATTGIIGLLSFLYFWLCIIKSVRKKIYVLASIASFGIGSLFINALFYNFLLMWMIVVLGTNWSNER